MDEEYEQLDEETQDIVDEYLEPLILSIKHILPKVLEEIKPIYEKSAEVQFEYFTCLRNEGFTRKEAIELVKLATLPVKIDSVCN